MTIDWIMPGITDGTFLFGSPIDWLIGYQIFSRLDHVIYCDGDDDDDDDDDYHPIDWL